MTATVRTTARWLVPSLAAIVLAGCGIDQGGINVDVPLPPTSLTGPAPLLLVGPVTAVSPLLVNGLELDPSAAMVTLDSVAGSVSGLAVGQVVSVIGEDENGTARALVIGYQENLRGPVDDIDASAGTLVVLGQMIVVDDGIGVPVTVDIASLDVGDIVEVSGFVREDGVLLATYIAESTGGAPLEITGLATSVDLPAQTFFVGALRVDYSGAGVINDLPAGEPQDGQAIEVEGVLASDGATLVASSLNAPAGLPAAVTQSDLVDIQDALASTPIVDGRVIFTGFVSSPGDAQFQLGDAVIAYDDTTTFSNGDAASLLEGALLQVDGRLDPAGTVTATTIILL